MIDRILVISSILSVIFFCHIVFLCVINVVVCDGTVESSILFLIIANALFDHRVVQKNSSQNHLINIIPVVKINSMSQHLNLVVLFNCLHYHLTNNIVWSRSILHQQVHDNHTPY